MTKKMIFAVMAMVLLTAAGCKEGVPQDIDFFSDKCSKQVTSFTVSYLKYGDGIMDILPISKVRPGAMFVIGLDPRDAFANADVTVSGMGDASWINGSDKFSNLTKDPIYGKVGFLEAGCVPEDAEDGQEYKYKIEVNDTASGVTNILDPRAVVIRN